MKYLTTFSLLAAATIARADAFVDGLAIPAASATNAAIVFQLRDQTRAALQMTSVLTAAGTGTLVATFALSVNGTNFETTPSLSITNSNAGTNFFCVTPLSDASASGAPRRFYRLLAQ